jgi:hypothetical protein
MGVLRDVRGHNFARGHSCLLQECYVGSMSDSATTHSRCQTIEVEPTCMVSNGLGCVVEYTSGKSRHSTENLVAKQCNDRGDLAASINLAE